MIDYSIIEKIYRLIELGRYKQAEKELYSILSIDSSSEEVHFLMANVKNELKDYGSALEYINNSIALNPFNADSYYLKAHILYSQENLFDAFKEIKAAIQLNPRKADYFGLLALIELYFESWQLALDYAECGLSIEADNIQCLNVRSKALFKLKRVEESQRTMKEALYFDPENSNTRTNHGWNLIEQGNHKEALEHFKIALSINPMDSNARLGIIEAIKSKNYFYRIFLRYVIWRADSGPFVQALITLGIIVGLRISFVLILGKTKLNSALILILVIFLSFVLLPWYANPIANLFLRFNKSGKLIITKEEIQNSNFVTASMIVGIVGMTMYLITNSHLWISIGIFGCTMVIPFSSMFNAKTDNENRIRLGYVVVLFLIGLTGIVSIFMNSLIIILIGVVYVVGVFLFEEIVNSLKSE